MLKKSSPLKQLGQMEPNAMSGIRTHNVSQCIKKCQLFKNKTRGSAH
jgi:hypothetical protein